MLSCHERFTDFQDFESDQAVVDVDLAALLEDSRQMDVVHPDGRLVCSVFVTLCRQHTHMAALFQLHLLLHHLHVHAHSVALDAKVTTGSFIRCYYTKDVSISYFIMGTDFKYQVNDNNTGTDHTRSWDRPPSDFT